MRPAQQSSIEYLISPRPQDVDPNLFRKVALGNMGVDRVPRESCGLLDLWRADQYVQQGGHEYSGGVR